MLPAAVTAFLLSLAPSAPPGTLCGVEVTDAQTFVERNLASLGAKLLEVNADHIAIDDVPHNRVLVLIRQPSGLPAYACRYVVTDGNVNRIQTQLLCVGTTFACDAIARRFR